MSLSLWDRRHLTEPKLEELLQLFDRQKYKRERTLILKVTTWVRRHQIETAYRWLMTDQRVVSRSQLHHYLAGRLACTYGDLVLSKSHLTQALYAPTMTDKDQHSYSRTNGELVKYIVISLMNLFAQCGQLNDLRVFINWRLSYEASYETYYMLGKLEEYTGSTQRAIKAYETALEISPQAHQCRLSLARALCDLGSIHRAETELARLRYEYRRSDVVWALSGRVFLAHSDTKRGLRALKKAIRINYRCSIAHTILGDYYSRHACKRSIKHYHLALDGDRPLYSLYDKLATLYQQLGRYDQAISQLSLMKYFATPEDQIKIQKKIRELNHKLDNDNKLKRDSSWWQRLVG